MLVDTNGNTAKIPVRELVKVKENPRIIQDLGIQVFGSKLIVRQAKMESKYVILPNGSAEVQKSEGYILAMGPDVDIPIEIGDYIAYGKYASWNLPEGDEENLYVVDSGDVLYKKNKPNTEDTK